MRFGYFVPYVRPDLSKPMAQVYRDAAEQIECAEAAGFDVIWFPEHHFTHNYCAPGPLLSVLDAAHRTRRVRVGTSVIVTPFHHPLVLAEQIGMVDHLVEGRLEIGFARGSSRFEYARFGMTDSEAAERQRETLDILLGVWKADDDFAYQGRHYTFPPVYIVPRPLQEPHPPMWIAARTPDTLRFCIERGLGLHTTTLRQPMTATYATLNTIDAIIADIGAPRRPPLAIQRETFVSEDPEKVRGAMEGVWRMHVRGFNQLRETRPSVRGYGSLDDLPDGMQLTVDQVIERSVVGTPEDCVRILREYQATGADEFIANMNAGQPQEDILRSLELFGSRVIPHFRGAGPTGRPGSAVSQPAGDGRGEERQAQLLRWNTRRFGEGWRQWTAAAWLEDFERRRAAGEPTAMHIFDFSVAPQNARADAGGVLEPSGRLLMIRDQACPKCGRPVIALACRWSGELAAHLKAEVAHRLSVLDWHALHP